MNSRDPYVIDLHLQLGQQRSDFRLKMGDVVLRGFARFRCILELGVDPGFFCEEILDTLVHGIDVGCAAGDERHLRERERAQA